MKNSQTCDKYVNKLHPMQIMQVRTVRDPRLRMAISDKESKGVQSRSSSIHHSFFGLTFQMTVISSI